MYDSKTTERMVGAVVQLDFISLSIDAVYNIISNIYSYESFSGQSLLLEMMKYTASLLKEIKYSRTAALTIILA
jgi:hypothetical protein